MILPKCWNEPAFPNVHRYRDGLTIGQYATIAAMQGLLANQGQMDQLGKECAKRASDLDQAADAQRTIFGKMAEGYARATLLELERLAAKGGDDD